MNHTHTLTLLIQITHHVSIYYSQSSVDHAFSAAILGLSLAGRWYAGKIGVTRLPFTASILSKIDLSSKLNSHSFLLLLVDSSERKEIRLHSCREKVF